ncbi:response regulator [Cohnella lupini]|uniref:Two-component SAPR family response regulator n=1 Tax=Cohnella lupini TaxID=1294267 RepID=A0A3D9IIP1_9BACL|nr:response regulator [Cohnella lupini]RED61608.1 two-component SAPR family response regulator [Cohnella lupini]
MKVILVDDEGLALRDLERQLGKIGGIDVVGTFKSAADALDRISALAPDVVFFDIDMPEISGLEAAERLHKIDSSIAIVFVTAYEEYAVKAFELAAMDYILKPVNTDRLTRTVQRLTQHRDSQSVLAEDPVVATVNCFQRLHIEYGKSEPFSWRTVRSQELFAYMVYKRNQPVRKDILLELLWPDTDYKKAFTQLYTTIYQVRKSLESAGISIKLTNSGTDYYLDLGNNKYDVQEWENAKLTLPDLTPETASLHLQWLRAYTGDYLAEQDYWWAENEKQRLRDVWYKHALEIGQMWKDAGFMKEALDIYEETEKRFPYLEVIYFVIMKFHAECGDGHLLSRKYEQLCAMLQEEYGIQPSLAVRQWMEQQGMSLGH